MADITEVTMIIIDQKAELLEHNIDPLKFIELCARTCYKSEDKITDESAEKTIRGLYKSNHWAMLEHEYLYFVLSIDRFYKFRSRFQFIENETQIPVFSFLHFAGESCVTGSIRAWLEFFEATATKSYPTADIDVTMLRLAHNQLPTLFGAPKCEEDVTGVKLLTREEFINTVNQDFLFTTLPHTIRFITNRGVSHELVRHRIASFAQESSRYVDYKSSNQITVIRPCIHETDIENYNNWHYAILMAETQYMNLRKQGIAPEIARGVLPNDCKTEIVVTATENEWQHIVDLRYHGTTGRPHPQIQQLMCMALPMLNKESNGRII